MRGDFARVTFDPLMHFTRVLQNQGRVQLEADWNEQGAIFLHLLRSLIVDLAGPAWRAGSGFALDWDGAARDVTISAGHCYIDGFLCENEKNTTFSTQPRRPTPDEPAVLSADKLGFVYIDAWERHVTAWEVPRLREVALGIAETASRAQLVWQIRFLDTDTIKARLDAAIDALAVQHLAAQKGNDPDAAEIENAGAALIELRNVLPTAFNCEHAQKVLAASIQTAGRLRARPSTPSNPETDPCSLSPASAYRGRENQLYRVEIHNRGDAKTATFKWSRENGGVTFPVLDANSDGKPPHTIVTLTHLGRDARLGLCAGDWVEYVDDDIVLAQHAGPMARVLGVDRGELTATLDALLTPDLKKHPLLRRWDQSQNLLGDGVSAIVEANDDSGWLELEDGIEVQFQPGGLYWTGDYWLIPARVATGGIEWPVNETSTQTPKPPLACKPNGVEHHTAPLGLLKPGQPPTISNCICTLPGLCTARTARARPA
jgi:hypothetical protein